MANKFLRNFVLSIATNPQNPAVNETITIYPPITIEFDITRNTLSSANIGSIRIYNLNKDLRNKLRKDQYDETFFPKVVLQAGYGPGPNYPSIFIGQVNQAWSVREGVNFVTQLESYDGAWAFNQAKIDTAFPKNTPLIDILTNMVSGLKAFDVDPGVVGTYNGAIQRANAYSGNTLDILRELTGGGTFIDNGLVHLLGENECFTGNLPVIDSSTGLLGTPMREATNLVFDMVFEPRLLAGQIIYLNSTTEDNFNQYYKVVGIKHRGMISTAVAGDAVTSVTLFYSPQPLKPLGSGNGQP